MTSQEYNKNLELVKRQNPKLPEYFLKNLAKDPKYISALATARVFNTIAGVGDPPKQRKEKKIRWQ